ncbi:uncharacterized protein LOC124341864 [Daphnia pulicaria]|uniref:uncharacterized protein LOC124341864 n=1 Tax=Daphnia pulicaria TaxID=35523 RepID=UPI001EEA340A|nr:uncharacterized protein LOC124341864 [Daphnia pulicaria]
MEKNALLSNCHCSVSTMCSADPPETASSTVQQQICQLQVELQLAFPLQLILAASGSDSIQLRLQPTNKRNNLNIATESVIAKISLYNSAEINGEEVKYKKQS